MGSTNSGGSLAEIPQAAGLAEETAVFKKVALRLMPVLFIVYVLSYLDRVNIGYAKLQFNADLGFSDAVYGLGAGIFFVGYMIFEIPSNLLLERVGARATISRIMVLWGVASACTMFIHSATSFYVMRFILGAAEAGLVPGVVLYLTYWFPQHWRARMFALFLAAIPVSGIIGAPLSGYLMTTLESVHPMRGWQWMFLIEGLPSIVVGIAVYFVLPNRPETTKWLSTHEKQLIANFLTCDGRRQAEGRNEVDKATLRSGMFVLLTSIYLCLSVGNVGFSFWLPQIVKDLGVSSLITNGLITTIPYAVAGVGMIVMGLSSDRKGERRWHYAFNSLLGATGIVICCLNTGTLAIAIAGLSMSYLGILSCYGIFWSSVTSFLRSDKAAVGIALINSIVSVASFSTPFGLGMLRDMTHSVNLGLYAIAVCLTLGALLAVRLPKKT
ncbi:MFS transporter [Paraburkholderia sediminicola]|uniref:MFS transporter n=1 Tax=Paraburkholderia sediminicola TaxID=458836 RepID=UPI0038BA90E4